VLLHGIIINHNLVFSEISVVFLTSSVNLIKFALKRVIIFFD